MEAGCDTCVRRRSGGKHSNASLSEEHPDHDGWRRTFRSGHPAYAGRDAAIIKELDARRYRKIPLNIRTAVVYSSARKAPPATPSKQRELNIKAHDQALALAGEAPETLKGLERTHRRIERLIDKLALIEKKKHLAEPFRKELEQLGLINLYARAKHFRPCRCLRQSSESSWER